MILRLVLLLALAGSACSPSADRPGENPSESRAGNPSESRADYPTESGADYPTESGVQNPATPYPDRFTDAATYAPAPTGKGDQRIFGYHAWWMRDTWRTYELNRYDKIFFFELRVTPDGGFEDPYGWPGEWLDMIDAVHAAGGTVAPTVAILDPITFASVFADEQVTERLLESVMGAVRSAGADGVHLNFEIFEQVDPAARGGLTGFVRRLRTRLHAYRDAAELTMFLPGFDHGETYDEAELASLVDRVVVQGYDMHWLTSEDAGPVAPITGWNGANWSAILSRYLALGVRRDQIVMTVPYFGYEWPTVSAEPGAATRGEGVPITYAPVSADLLPLIRISATERTAAFGARRDPVSGSPYYAYEGADGWYQGWYEDAQSLDAKYDFVQREGLAGIAIFLLGYDGGGLEPALRTAFR